METLPSGIRYRHWHAEGETRAAVVLVHGLGEHSARYQALAAHFSGRGFAVIAPDHLGHGESPGDRVYVDRFDDYLAGVRECRQVMATQYSQCPCFLLGHSMGGLISARLLLEDQSLYRGALLSGPAFAAEAPPPAIVISIGKLLSRIAPKMGMIELDSTGVSRDPAVVSAYQADPLVNHGKVTTRLSVELLGTMERVMQAAGDITLPLLIMHGAADSMAAPSGSQQFAETVGSHDLTFKLLPGLYHEIFNEPEGPEIIAEFADWIEARL